MKAPQVHSFLPTILAMKFSLLRLRPNSHNRAATAPAVVSVFRAGRVEGRVGPAMFFFYQKPQQSSPVCPYWFPITAEPNCLQLSGLHSTNALSPSSGGRKSETGFTGLKPRCQRLEGRIHFLAFSCFYRLPTFPGLWPPHLQIRQDFLRTHTTNTDSSASSLHAYGP